MASYTILSVKQVEDTLFTEVMYVNNLNEKVTVSIAHFQPMTAADVELAISNRFVSEDKKIQAEKAAVSVASSLMLNKEVILNG